MKMKLRLLAALAALATMPYALTGCGGTECGEGTTEQDGQCVAETTDESVTCADGTTLTDGKCEADVSGCGANTSLNDDGECVADEGPDPAESCGTGTQYDEGAGECVPTSTIECGEGTTEEGGECIADPQDSTCQAGTSLADDGSCVVDTSACGSKTQLDPNSNTCLATDELCGANTAYDADSDSCVPTDAVCDAGTVYSMDTGLCLPEATCKMGDVILNGNCVSPVEEAIANADFTSNEAADPVANNDDPLLGGTTNDLTIPAMGTFVAAGEIGTPVDLDGDMREDQDVDSYTFSATAGQTFQISVQPTAGPSLAFAIGETSAINTLTPEEAFVRFSTFGLNAGSSRSVVIPEDGDYTIFVAPSFYLANGFEGGPSGADNWTYALRIEEVAPYMPTDVDTSMGPITGEFANLSDNLFRLTNYTGGPATFTIDRIGEDIGGAKLQISTVNGIFGTFDIFEGDEEQILLPQGDVFFFFDWTTAFGQDTAFEVSLTPTMTDGDLGTITPGAPVNTMPADYAGDQTRTYTFSTNSGDFIEFTHTNTEGEEVDITITNSRGEEVFSQTFFDVLGDTAPDVGYVYSPVADTLLIEIQNSSSTDPLTGEVLTLNAITPTDQGMFGAGGMLSITQPNPVGLKYTEFHRVNISEQVLYTGTLADDGNGTDGTDNVDLLILDATNGQVVTPFDENGDEDITGFRFFQPGDYIFAVVADDALTNGYSLNMDFTMPPGALEVEPNDTTNTATPLPPFPFTITGTGGWNGGGQPREFSSANVPFDYFSFEIMTDFLPGEELYLTLESIGMTDPSTGPYIIIYDGQGNEIGSSGTATTFKEASITDLTAGTYYVGVAVSFVTGFNTLYEFKGEIIPPPFMEMEPNDMVANATALPDLNTPAIGANQRDGADLDIFSFTVATPGVYAVEVATTGASGCGVVALHNAAGDVIEQASGSATLTVGAYLQANTYLFSVSGDAAGCAGDTAAFDYETAILNPMPMADGFDVELNNDSASAVMVAGDPLTVTALGTITSPTDEDWYMFTLAADASLLALPGAFGPGPAPHAGMTFEFFDAAGTTSLGVNSANLTAGNFFVKVSGFNSTDFVGNSYELNLVLKPADYFDTPNLAIPDNDANGATTTLSVPDACIITDMEVVMDITHTYKGDILLDLIAPDGTTTVRLHNATGGSTDNIIETYGTNGTAPAEPLSGFNGLEAMGTWTLRVEDTFNGDTGTVNLWGLNFTCM